MDGVGSFTSITVPHACGHTRLHNIPTVLADPAVQHIHAQLAQEPCSECIVEEAWERLGIAPPTNDFASLLVAA